MSHVRLYPQLGTRYPSLLGLGQGSAICLDQSQNTIPCSDPGCTYGDCGSGGPQVTRGPLCLDQNENATACADPSCTYGDCISMGKSVARAGTITAPTIATSLNLPARPSPVVNVPLSSSTIGMWLANSTVIPGLPNGVIAAAVAALAFSALAAGGRRR